MSNSRAGYAKFTPSTPNFPVALAPLAGAGAPTPSEDVHTIRTTILHEDEDESSEDEMRLDAVWGSSSRLKRYSQFDWHQPWRTLHQPRWVVQGTTSMRSFVADNAGLLLVALSQFFFALMNVMVKKLNALDPPVPPLEVRLILRLLLPFIALTDLVTSIARCCSNGEHMSDIFDWQTDAEGDLCRASHMFVVLHT
jgi:hypothetical protein